MYPEASVAAQRDHRRDTQCAERRYQRGDQRDDAEQHCDAEEGCRIVDGDAVQQTGQQLRKPQRQKQAHADAGQQLAQALSQHHPHDAAVAGTQCAAHADLARAQADLVGERGVQPGRGQ